MGCGDSRLPPDDEIPPGLRPFWQRMEDLRFRRRERKDIVVSTTELLHPEKKNRIEEESNWKAAEDNGRMIRRERSSAEELPGSPSFRLYLHEAGEGKGAIGNLACGSPARETQRDVKEMPNESN